MSELFREIEEDIRREQMGKLWGRFGRLVIGASIAVVMATAGYVFWQSQKQAQDQVQTAKLVQGIDLFNHQDYKGAIAAFSALSEDGHSPYYGIAMLHKGQTQAASGDKAGAEKTFADLAKHDKVFGALAMMQMPYSADHPMQPDKNSSFYFTQSEWAGWELLQQGKKDAAAAQFLVLHDSANAPYSMRQRMQEAMQYIAPDKTTSSKDTSHE